MLNKRGLANASSFSNFFGGIMENNEINMTEKDAQFFEETLRNPPPISPALREATKRYKEMVESGELKVEK